MAVVYSQMNAGQLANAMETGDLAPILFVYLQVNPDAVNEMLKAKCPSFYDAFQSKMLMMSDDTLCAFLKNHILCGNIPITELPRIQIQNGNTIGANALAMVKNRQTFNKKLV